MSTRSSQDFSFLGCLLQWTALLAIGGVIYFFTTAESRSFTNKFQSNLNEYLAIDAQEDLSQPHTVGKIIVINKETATIDTDITLKLPNRLKPILPVEVGTVVYLSCHQKQVGVYTSGGKALSQVCDVEVIDRQMKKLVSRNTFEGGQPPETKRGTGDATGSRPDQAIIDYLANLPSQNRNLSTEDQAAIAAAIQSEEFGEQLPVIIVAIVLPLLIIVYILATTKARARRRVAQAAVLGASVPQVELSPEGEILGSPRAVPGPKPNSWICSKCKGFIRQDARVCKHCKISLT